MEQNSEMQFTVDSMICRSTKQEWLSNTNPGGIINVGGVAVFQLVVRIAIVQFTHQVTEAEIGAQTSSVLGAYRVIYIARGSR